MRHRFRFFAHRATAARRDFSLRSSGVSFAYSLRAPAQDGSGAMPALSRGIFTTCLPLDPLLSRALLVLEPRHDPNVRLKIGYEYLLRPDYKTSCFQAQSL